MLTLVELFQYFVDLHLLRTLLMVLELPIIFVFLFLLYRFRVDLDKKIKDIKDTCATLRKNFINSQLLFLEDQWSNVLVEKLKKQFMRACKNSTKSKKGEKK